MHLHVQVAWFWALSGFVLILYCTVHTILYSTVKGYEYEGVGQKYSISALKHLFMLGSLSSIERWSVTKPHSVFPTDVTWLSSYSVKTVLFSDWPKIRCLFPIGCKFWLRGKFIFFNLDIQAEGSELQASASLFYSLMPSFSSMPIFGVSKMLLDLLDVTKTVWSAPSGVPSVRRLEEPLYWVFLSALCLTSVGSLYVLYDI